MLFIFKVKSRICRQPDTVKMNLPEIILPLCIANLATFIDPYLAFIEMLDSIAVSFQES
ncbi:MAG: hypothetical protein QNJ74_20925 [Trichodesmium sp. MO_231.B1]|nr:hypothetical protein [Trichodesmium sp. MO_231.B1]